jgi:glucose/mannose-6-phosphate isomerase
MNEKNIKLYDKSDMRNLLLGFSSQVEEAVNIGSSAKININTDKIKNIVVTGLGGSAIGGDLVRSYLAGELKIPFIVNRHYFLPEFVDNNSLVIVSSYSGNTEETIAAHKDAVKRGAQVLCISSNGETEQLAKKHGHSFIKIPGGLPPRAALGYSFFPILMSLIKMKFITTRTNDIKETISLLKKKSQVFSTLNLKKNATLSIAQSLYNKLAIIYSSADRLDSVNIRWRGQLSENSKVLAFGNTLPEMNHNELVGWKVLKKEMSSMVVIFLKDKDDHKRVRFRMNIMDGIVQEFASDVIHVDSEGKSLLARMFSLIHMGDWVSYYLAIINGVDPTPVKVIDYLKNELAKL